MGKPSVGSSEDKTREIAVELREKWVREFKSEEAYDLENPKIAAEWREKWLSGIKLGKSYDLEARYNSVRWAAKWAMESAQYSLDGFNVGPFCAELVLEVLQLHGGRPILPVRIDRLEDITIGLGAGFSGQGEVCGAVTGHIIALGMDVAYRTRETAMIRKEVAITTRKFCRLFKERFGALRCADLTGLNFLKPDGSDNPDAWKEFTTGSSHIGIRCMDFIQFCIYAPFPSEEG